MNANSNVTLFDGVINKFIVDSNLLTNLNSRACFFTNESNTSLQLSNNKFSNITQYQKTILNTNHGKITGNQVNVDLNTNENIFRTALDSAPSLGRFHSGDFFITTGSSPTLWLCTKGGTDGQAQFKQVAFQ